MTSPIHLLIEIGLRRKIGGQDAWLRFVRKREIDSVGRKFNEDILHVICTEVNEKNWLKN
jgi:hypothetical protein